MRLNVLAPLVVGVCLLATSASADVRVTVADGLVSISAQDATTRQILAEWARVGQMRIVNLDRVSGAPMTIELSNVPETQALDTLLRQMIGYLAAPRAVAIPGASHFDRLYLMTGGSGAPVAASAPAPVSSGRPAFVQAPVFVPPVVDEDDPPQPPPGAPPVAYQPPSARPGSQRPTVFSTFPQQPPPDNDDEQPEAPAAAPAAPAGVARPGMVVPAPPQPGTPNSTNRR